MTRETKSRQHAIDSVWAEDLWRIDKAGRYSVRPPTVQPQGNETRSTAHELMELGACSLNLNAHHGLYIKFLITTSSHTP